jgi:hypothetical protein
MLGLAKLKSNGKRHLVSDHSEQEMHQTSFTYPDFAADTLISLTSFVGIPHSMIILYNTPLLIGSGLTILKLVLYFFP